MYRISDATLKRFEKNLFKLFLRVCVYVCVYPDLFIWKETMNKMFRKTSMINVSNFWIKKKKKKGKIYI